MLIGLSGFAQVGKDSAGAALVNKLGYERRAFADKVREVYYAQDPYVSVTNISEEHIDHYFAKVSELVDKWGWDEAKKVPDVRQGLQRVGDSLRRIIGENVWMEACLRGVTPHKDNIVITDCRHINEAETIRAAKGYVIRIERPGYGPINNHISETALTTYPFFSAVIQNDGTIGQLSERIIRVVEDLTCDASLPTISEMDTE